MRSRSERYSDRSNVVRTRATRTKRNEHLYDDLNHKIGLEVINFDTQTGIDLSSLVKEEPVNINNPEQNIDAVEQDTSEVKVFDVNSILEEAKKNRTEIDELEKKRKLKNEEYNVLSDLNKKYITQKDKINKELEEEGLEELIHTITSNTLVKDVKDQELLSELLPTSTNIELPQSKTEQINSVQKTEDGHLVNSFYTKSMDLSEEDFEMSEEFVDNGKKKKTLLIILVVIILLSIIVTVAYFILKGKNII